MCGAGGGRWWVRWGGLRVREKLEMMLQCGAGTGSGAALGVRAARRAPRCTTSALRAFAGGVCSPRGAHWTDRVRSTQKAWARRT